MPVDVSRLVTDGVVIVSAEDQVGAVLRQLPEERSRRVFAYVIFPVTASTYQVVQWQQIEQIARDAGRDLRTDAIGTLPGLPAPVPAIEADSMSMREATDLRDEQRPLRVLVVLRGGMLVGLLATATRADEDLASDPFQPTAAAEPPLSSPPAPEVEIIPGAVVVDESALVLGDDDPALPLPEPAPEAASVDDRVINAWVDDDQVQDGAPLQVGESYELKFSIESPRKGTLATAAFSANTVFDSLPPNTTQAEVGVVLDSDDFEIIGEQQSAIVVPRTGKSRKNATFTISPKKNGVGEIRALFFAGGRLFQRMKLSVQVGAVAPQSAPVSVETSGRTFASAVVASPRLQQVDLIISKRDAGYEFILNSGGFKRATVNLSEQQIADLVATTRDELKKIVYAKDGARYVYQTADTNVPATVHAQTLKALQGVGFDLFEALFFAPGSGSDAQEMGKVLRQRSQAAKLHIAIVAERFAFPWALLYDRDFDPDKVEPEGFWGFKHIIEYSPEFRLATTSSFTPEITVGDTLEVGFVVNTTIDDELRRKGSQVDVIKPQQEFFKTLAGVNVTEYPNGSDLLRLLRDGAGKTQLIYFYCHADSALPGAVGGVDASLIKLSDGPLTLKDMKRGAPLSKTEENLQSCPLVFLNACESAELSPYIYDGLVPYLIAKGARGVLGTEVNTPALFAAEFAPEFLKRFVAGNQPLGELLLQLRREYLFNKNNVMGLVYALHSGAEVVVRRTATV